MVEKRKILAPAGDRTTVVNPIAWSLTICHPGEIVLPKEGRKLYKIEYVNEDSGTLSQFNFAT
jgi:hypothetical protein